MVGKNPNSWRGSHCPYGSAARGRRGSGGAALCMGRRAAVTGITTHQAAFTGSIAGINALVHSSRARQQKAWAGNTSATELYSIGLSMVQISARLN